jgi:glycosyltransferase involved in cell wall biosynthesis
VKILLLAPDSLKIPDCCHNVDRIPFRWPAANPLPRAIWERIYLPKLLTNRDVDVLFCPGGLLNVSVPSRCKTVTMSRNMIPFDERQQSSLPLGYPRFRNWLLKKLMLSSMNKADLVIFVSEYAKHVVERQRAASLRNTTVIPHGINPAFRSAGTGNVPDARGSSTGYFLYVSALDFYKAQVEVVQAFALLKQRRPTLEKLLLVGPEFPRYGDRVRQEIARLGLQHEVLLAGMLPYDQLPGLYQNATINIFASHCENCPNILLEALAAGRPTVVSDRAPMPEIAGDAAAYFDPSSPERLATVLADVLSNPARMSELGERAKKRSLLYDWRRTATDTLSAIRQLKHC